VKYSRLPTGFERSFSRIATGSLSYRMLRSQYEPDVEVQCMQHIKI